MNASSCFWPCHPSSPHLGSLPVPVHSAPVWVSKSSGLCLSPQAGCQSQARSRAQQDALGTGWPRVLLAAAPAAIGSTVPAGGHRAEVTRWGTRAASHCSWGPVALAGHTHSPGVLHRPPPPGLPHHSPGSSLHTTDMQPDPLGTRPGSTEMNTICLSTGVRGLPAFTFQ